MQEDACGRACGSASGARRVTTTSRLRPMCSTTTELLDYIEVFYNQRRRHSTIGQISPAEYERRTRAA
jgi:transposase InsO family protein